MSNVDSASRGSALSRRPLPLRILSAVVASFFFAWLAKVLGADRTVQIIVGVGWLLVNLATFVAASYARRPDRGQRHI